MKSEFGTLVFSSSGNTPQKVFIGDNSIEFYMQSNIIYCDFINNGNSFKFNLDVKSVCAEMLLYLENKSTVRVKRSNNRASVIIRALKSVKILRVGAVNKSIDT